jgi:hypothetical protein
VNILLRIGHARWTLRKVRSSLARAVSTVQFVGRAVNQPLSMRSHPADRRALELSPGKVHSWDLCQLCLLLLTMRLHPPTPKALMFQPPATRMLLATIANQEQVVRQHEKGTLMTLLELVRLPPLMARAIWSFGGRKWSLAREKCGSASWMDA